MPADIMATLRPFAASLADVAMMLVCIVATRFGRTTAPGCICVRPLPESMEVPDNVRYDEKQKSRTEGPYGWRLVLFMFEEHPMSKHRSGQ